jgi:hypothetical protein
LLKTVNFKNALYKNTENFRANQRHGHNDGGENTGVLSPILLRASPCHCVTSPFDNRRGLWTARPHGLRFAAPAALSAISITNILALQNQVIIAYNCDTKK